MGPEQRDIGNATIDHNRITGIAAPYAPLNYLRKEPGGDGIIIVVAPDADIFGEIP